jgi:hypothetical protein
MPIESSNELAIVINGTTLDIKPEIPERIYLCFEQDKWGIKPWIKQKTSGPRAYGAGAEYHLYDGTPLVAVYGTLADTAVTGALKGAAMSVADHLGGITQDKIFSGGIPVKADTEVTMDHIKHCNLVLFGNHRENAVVKKIYPELPFEVNHRHELDAGGMPPVSIRGAGVRAIYYNPLNTKRLVYLVFVDSYTRDSRAWMESIHVPMESYSAFTARPDLVVQTIGSAFFRRSALKWSGIWGGPLRRCMQFTSGWQWKPVPADDKPAPGATASFNSFTREVVKSLQKEAGIDYFLYFKMDNKDMIYDPAYFRMSDLKIIANPTLLVIADFTREDLRKYLEKSDDIVFYPALDTTALEKDRIYNVALQASSIWRVRATKQHLKNMRLGPDITAAAWAPCE